MKLKFNQIINSVKALNELLEKDIQDNEIKYKLANIITAITPFITEFNIEKTRITNNFNHEINTVLESEIDINIEKLKLTDLEKFDLKTTDFINLNYLIDKN